MYEYESDENLTLGVQMVAIVFAVGMGAYANYHFTGVSNSGWVLGVDALDVYSTWNDEQDRFVVSASLGYKF